MERRVQYPLHKPRQDETSKRMLRFSVFIIFTIFSMSNQCQTPPPKPQPSQTELCNCGVAQQSASRNRIISYAIGGDKASKYEYPWQAYLTMKHNQTNGKTCGGSLISNRHILSAAHCTMGYSASQITVFLGKHHIRDIPEHAVTISKVTNYPQYRRDDSINTLYNDLSILTLSSPVSFSPAALPVCLPGYVNKSYQGEVATVTGWGHTIAGDKSSGASVLQKVDVTVWSNTDCRKAYHNRGIERYSYNNDQSQ